MLDEPLGALDRHLRERLVEDLGRLFRELGQSVLVVTHDHDEAFGLADRVAILHAGRVEQVDEPVELWRHPRTEFVARFLGWNVIATNGRRDARAVRPDALLLAADGELRGAVRARTFRRDHWSVQVALEPDGALVDVVVRDEDPPSTGAHVHLTVEPSGSVEL
jgi:thiamine transport system ATP-binding protein